MTSALPHIHPCADHAAREVLGKAFETTPRPESDHGANQYAPSKKLAAVYGESSARYPRPQGKPAHQLWSE